MTKEAAERQILSEVRDLLKVLWETEDVDHCLKRIVELAHQWVPSVGSSIRLFDVRCEYFVAVARAGASVHRPLTRLAVGEGVIGWVADQGKTAWVNDAAQDDRFVARKDQQHEVGSLICVPLISWGKVTGVMGVAHEHAGIYTKDHVRRLEVLANLAVPVLEISRLKEMALTDPLTGTFNRRYFDRRLDEEVRRSLRYRHPLTLAVVDVDDFSRLNEVFGRLVGDQVLQFVADQLAFNLRAHDVISRRGADAFVILMPETEVDDAHYVLKRLLVGMHDHELPPHPKKGQPWTVSLSGGLAVYRRGEHPNGLLEQAEFAMLRAQELGGDRIEIAS